MFLNIELIKSFLLLHVSPRCWRADLGGLVLGAGLRCQLFPLCVLCNVQLALCLVQCSTNVQVVLCIVEVPLVQFSTILA